MANVKINYHAESVYKYVSYSVNLLSGGIFVHMHLFRKTRLRGPDPLGSLHQ